MIKKILNYLILLLIFLLPLQTRYINEYGSLNGGYWEYGTFSLYGTQILLWLIVLIFGINKFFKKEFWRPIITKEHLSKSYKRLIFLLFFLLFNFINILYSIDRQ